MFSVTANGETVTIRTCAVENWGTQCGDLRLKRSDNEGDYDSITGCLASCGLDGCNTGRTLHVSWILILLGTLYTASTYITV